MSDKGKDTFEDFNNCECNPFRPTNQLPFPGCAGQLLVTKSDFTLPARPDLLEWKDIEEVIGVANIKLTFTNNDAVAHIWKLINNIWVEVGAIGQITEEEAIKLQSIEYIQYIVLEDVANHKIKLMGKKTKEGSYEDISTVNFVNYSDYANFKTTTQGDIEGIETLLSELQATVETHGTEITSINETIETMEANLAVINPIINILRQATNPGKVLVKSSDGASIEWKVLASIQGITLELDTVTNTLKLYQNNGGVEQLVGQWDNINRNEITSITNLLQPIANSLNQAGEAGEVLTKTSDGLHYNWKALEELITGSVTTDTTDSSYWKVSIKLNNETFIDFVVPKKTLIDSILSDIIEIEDNIQYLQEETARLETAKQGKLTAGANITISANNVISASGEVTPVEVDDETIEFTEDNKLKVKHDDTLIVGANGLSVATDLMSIGHNDDEQLEVIHDTNKGLNVGDAGLEVKVDNSSINFNSNGQLQATSQTTAWGSITGTLDNQTDLKNKFDNINDNASIIYNDDNKLALNHDTTLSVSDSHGVGVNVDGSTIATNSQGQVATKVDTTKGLLINVNGIAINADNKFFNFENNKITTKRISERTILKKFTKDDVVETSTGTIEFSYTITTNDLDAQYFLINVSTSTQTNNQVSGTVYTTISVNNDILTNININRQVFKITNDRNVPFVINGIIPAIFLKLNSEIKIILSTPNETATITQEGTVANIAKIK